MPVGAVEPLVLEQCIALEQCMAVPGLCRGQFRAGFDLFDRCRGPKWPEWPKDWTNFTHCRCRFRIFRAYS